MRMLKDYRKYRILYRAVLRMQGFCKSWEIRRAYMEVRSAAKVFQKYARSYLAHQKLLDMKESEDPALTKEKKKEEILKILYPERFGRGKMNLSGKRRPMRLQPVKVAGDDEGDVEYLEMPKFAIVHEGWLNVKIGMMGKWQKTYVALKQGTLTLFEDHESLTAIISYNMANCLVKAEDAQIVITRTEKLYKHKVRSFRDMGRRIKGPLWGQDVILFQITPDIKEAGKVWADKLEESLCEAKLVDSYKMQVNLDGDDDEKPVNQKVASIIKEGYLRKKKPGNSAVQDMKRTWERRYFVLYNDGKLKYYDSRAKGEEKGSLDMRFFAIQEIEEEMEVDDEDEPGGEKQSLKVQGQFFKIMKGKQFGLYSGKHCFYMASPEREVCDEWISTLQTTLSILYQKSPLFSQDFLRVYMMDGTFTTMPLTETTKTRDVVKFMCKKHTLNNESEFGLLELWDHPGINGNMSERKLPNDELLLDQTMLTWEQARGPARDPVAHSTRPPHTSHPTPPLTRRRASASASSTRCRTRRSSS